MNDWVSQFGLFSVYSFLGWVCETAYCSVLDRRFVNRGFLNGPFCPIYGFGALLVIDLFSRYADDLPALFMLSVFVTSAVEYVTSFLLEKLFHLSLWDYSGRKWNLNGRICLRNSVMFGVLSVLMIRGIHPAATRLFGIMPGWLLMTLMIVLALYFALDITVTVIVLVQINKEAGRIQFELSFSQLAEVRERCLDAVHERMRGFQRTVSVRLMKAFPKMRSVRFPEALEELREHLKRIKRRN